MQISNAYSSETLFLSHLFTTQSQAPRCNGQILKEELGMKTQQGMGDVSIKSGNPSGNESDLFFVDISGDEERTGNEQRGLGSLVNLSGDPFEILFRCLVGYAAEGLMKGFVPGFDVKFDTSPGDQRKLSHLF
jgi:hypothetical protein